MESPRLHTVPGMRPSRRGPQLPHGAEYPGNERVLPVDRSTVRKPLSYTVAVGLRWADEDAAYIRSRSSRYAGALDIEPAWTVEVMADARLVELSPYPTSRVGATGFIGYSPSAGKVIVVIAYRDLDDDLHGMNA
jgi:hypothetical protein